MSEASSLRSIRSWHFHSVYLQHSRQTDINHSVSHTKCIKMLLAQERWSVTITQWIRGTIWSWNWPKYLKTQKYLLRRHLKWYITVCISRTLDRQESVTVCHLQSTLKTQRHLLQKTYKIAIYTVCISSTVDRQESVTVCHLQSASKCFWLKSGEAWQ